MAQVYACYHQVDKAGFPLLDFHPSSTAFWKALAQCICRSLLMPHNLGIQCKIKQQHCHL